MRFIRPDGKEESVSTIADYLAAVSAGTLKADSLVFDEDTKSWVKAETTREFRSLQAGRSIESTKQESRRATHIRWAALAIISAGLIAAFLAEPFFHLSSFDLGRRAGQGLTVLGLVALIGYAAFRKCSNLSKAYLSLAAATLFFAWMLVGFLAGADQSRKNEEIRNAAAKALEQIEHEHRKAAALEQPEPGAAVPPPQSSALPPFDAEANLTFAQFMARLPSIRTENARAVQAFQREAEALNLESVLLPERLVSQTGIAEGRRKLSTYEVLITKQSRFLQAKQQELRLMATRIQMSPSESESFWTGC